MDKDLSFKTNDVGQCLIGCLINEDINDYTNGNFLRQLSRALNIELLLQMFY